MGHRSNIIDGPYILWQNYGYEGWQPKSFLTLEDALLAEKYSTEFIITKPVNFEAKELP